MTSGIDKVPLQKETKQATFETLCTDFGIDDKVRQLFMDSPIENLQEFRFYFTAEDQIDAFVAAEKDLKDSGLRIQIARVRRAWAAVRQVASKREAGGLTSSVAELDDLLEEVTLREVKVQFWKRYRQRYPVEIYPADSLVSRCFRELEKRLLTVFNVRSVKNLMHQVTTTRKRKMLATDLYMYEDEPVAVQKDAHYTVEAYLAQLYTYLLALAIAGSAKVSGAPASEEFGSDSTSFVVAPWDVLEAYYFRACRAAKTVPEALRADWLERMDVAERGVWVEKFRMGEQTIGTVVKTVFPGA